jgi:radical SAM protein (TIGR01212 family)
MMIDYAEKVHKKKAQVFPWGTTRPYNAYKDYLRTRFEGRLQKVSVDAGFTCPNRDGVKAIGGCTYCNNDSFVPPYCKPGMSIAEQVDAGVEYLSRRYKARQFVVYFQAYSNTYAPLEYLKTLYSQALKHPQVRGLVIGTRPDCVDQAKITYFEQLARDYYIS